MLHVERAPPQLERSGILLQPVLLHLPASVSEFLQPGFRRTWLAAPVVQHPMWVVGQLLPGVVLVLREVAEQAAALVAGAWPSWLAGRDHSQAPVHQVHWRTARTTELD